MQVLEKRKQWYNLDMSAPEIEKAPDQVPAEISVIPEVPAMSDSATSQGVVVHPTQMTQTVTDDSGNNLINSPATQKVTIEIPVAGETLEAMAKGSIMSSATWYAIYWIRIVKKAVKSGWNVIFAKGTSGNPVNNS